MAKRVSLHNISAISTAVLAMVSAQFVGMGAANAQGVNDPIPDAPVEMLSAYMQAKHYSIMDIAVLENYSLDFLTDQYLAAEGNTIKKQAVLQEALDRINNHRIATRVVLYMPANLGEYDMARKRFPISYPTYPLHLPPGPAGWSAGIVHTVDTDAPAPAGSKNWSYCTQFPVFGNARDVFSALAEGSHFDVAAFCQDHVKLSRPQRDRRFQYGSQEFPIQTELVPTTFRVVLAKAPADWNYLELDTPQASQLIDQYAQAAKINPAWAHRIWVAMVVDLTQMDLGPFPNAESDEGGSSAEKQRVGANFTAVPQAEYGYFPRPCRGYQRDCLGGLEAKYALFGKGALSGHLPPPDGVITGSMIAARPEPSAIAGSPAAPQPVTDQGGPSSGRARSGLLSGRHTGSDSGLPGAVAEPTTATQSVPEVNIGGSARTR